MEKFKLINLNNIFKSFQLLRNMIQLMQNQGRIVMESDCGNDVVNFDDFVRVFAHFRPPKKNPDKNLMNTRDDKLRCKNTFVFGGGGS